MNNEELDAVCGRFADLKSKIMIYRSGGDLAYDGPIETSASDWYKSRGYDVKEIFPPVSTSWEAAGRLMDALVKSCSTCNTVSKTVKQFFGATCPMCHGKPAIWVSIHNAHGSWVAVVRNSGCTQQAQGEADSGPMALALAVAELAKESAR